MVVAPRNFEIQNRPIGKKRRPLKYPSDVLIAEKAFAEELKFSQQARYAIVTCIVREMLDDETAYEEDTFIRRIIRRMKIIEKERS